VLIDIVTKDVDLVTAVGTESGPLARAVADRRRSNLVIVAVFCAYWQHRSLIGDNENSVFLLTNAGALLVPEGDSE
jgi:hypothetical protein